MERINQLFISGFTSDSNQRHPLTFYALISLIVFQVLLPKSVSELFGIIPTRLLLMSVFLLVAYAEILLKRIKLNSIRIKILVIPYVSFLLMALPSIIVSPNKLISVYTLSKFIVFLLLLIAVMKISFSTQEYKIIVVVFVGMLIFLVLQGLYEYYYDPSLFKIGIEHYVGARGRIATNFFNTIYYGIFINLVYVYLLIIYSRVKKILIRFILGILLLLIYCNLIFTFTRSSFMVFWGIMVLLFIFDPKLYLKKSIQLILVFLIALTLSLKGSVSFVSASFKSTISIAENFNDILNLVPDFLSIGKKTIPVVSIKFEDASYTLDKKGATLILNPVIMPADASDKEVVWSTNRPDIVTVDAQGKITALKNGTAVISVKTKDSDKTASIKVVVSYQPILVNAIQTNFSTLTLDAYQKSISIEAVVLPETAEDRSIIWSSSDEKVVKVDQNGKATAVSIGAAVITVMSTDGKVKSEIAVKVDYPVISVSEIKLNVLDITLTSYGATKQLAATIFPNEATIKDISFSSDNPSVATIDKTGLVTAKGNGRAIITVKSYDGAITARATVNVIYQHISVTEISFAETEVLVTNLNENIHLTPLITPDDATIKNLIWSSSDKSVASVDNEGKVLPLKNGEVTITATTTDGGLSASYQLIVKQFVPIPDYSLIHRNEFAKIAYRIGNDNFFTGVGFGSYIDFMDSEKFIQNYPDYQFSHTHPHSSVILLFAETGALSLVAFIMFAISLFWMSLKNYFSYKNNTSSTSSIARVLPIIVIGFVIVCSIAENAVYDTQIFALFLIITGLSFSFCAGQRKDKTVLFVSSAGGHLTELLHLETLFGQYHSVVITEKTETTKSIKLRGVDIVFLNYASRSNMIRFIWINVRNVFASVVLFTKYAPHVIVTTGANTAVPLCLIGKLLGSKIIYIETVANSEKSSITGKIIYPISDLFIVQWESMLKHFPKAVYWGWLF